MQVITIADAIVADTNTDFELPNGYDYHSDAFIQIEISGTFTVQVLGKLHEDASYIELIAAGTTDRFAEITYVPFIRVTTSGGSATPICSVWVMVGEGKFGRRQRIDVD